MRQNILFFTTVLSFSILLMGCKSDPSTNESDQDADSTEVADTLSEDDMSQDTLSEEKDTAEVVYEDPAVQEAHEEIVKKYGTQWDFCTCVQKNDSVNKAMLADGVSDEKMDQLFERSSQIDEKCKGLLIQPNATPEDRAKHEIKVKKCLEGQ